MKRGRKRKEISSQQASAVPEPPPEAASEGQNEVDEANIDPLEQDDGIVDDGEVATENNWVWEHVDIPDCRVTRTRTEVKYDHQLPVFKGRQAGPINIPKDCKTPINFFRLFMDDEIMDEFVSNSNSFMANSNHPNAQRITRQELFHLFACFMYMGMVNKPTMSDHFIDGPLGKSEFCHNLFSLNRYEFVLSMLHWQDNSTKTKAEKDKEREMDGYWSLSTFLDKLSANFSKYYSLGQMFDIDEMCIFYSGRHRCRCFNKSKPAPYHLKGFCTNCSRTGYLHKFYMYRGATEKRPNNVAASLWPTIKLLDDSIYHDKNHILSTDNWYTQIPQLEWCLARGIHVNGTVKTNKKYIPKEAIFRETGPNKKKRGDMKCMKIEKNGKTYYMTSWQDKRPVHLLHTYKTYKKTVQRKSQDASGAYRPINLPQPTIIQDYNAGMGGTDMIDQRCSYYKFEHRTTKWQHRLISHFNLVSVVNAFILWKESKPLERKNVSQKQFMFDLMKELGEYVEEVEEQTEDKLPLQEPSNNMRTRTATLIRNTARLQGFHHASKKDSSDSRGTCRVCKKRGISTYCVECQAFLHIDGEYGENCFWRFHNEENFQVEN
jgi:hypothetical protein